MTDAPALSPLACALPELTPVAGVRLGACAAHIRYANRLDLMMMVFAQDTAIAGVFTKSRCPGAPVDWCKSCLPNGRARALVVNSGNANVFTGQAGTLATKATATRAAQLIGCAPEDVFLASTGVIGEPLPVEKLIAALPALHDSLTEDAWGDATRAIMTTDTFPKAVTRRVMIGETSVTIQGMAKGSGMIAPDLATMLAFVTTDAKIAPPALQELLAETIQSSFNCITVDSDMSTSDTVLAFATGAADHPEITHVNDPRLVAFRNVLADAMQELAIMVVRDGEGARKLIEVAVTGAEDDASARRVGLAVANSPLVKTAIAGEDANWGRIVMAVGKSGEPADPDTLSVGIGGFWMARNGQLDPSYREAQVQTHLKRSHITVQVDLGLAEGTALVWGCDLTHGYIDINADYRS